MKYPCDGTEFELDDETVNLLYRAIQGKNLTSDEQREAVNAVDYISAATLFIEPEDEETDE